MTQDTTASFSGVPRWSLLSGQWRDLCLFNYAVEPERLRRHLPPGVTLDFLDGKAFISLVALRFRDSHVLGLPFLGHRDYPQVNLRFYVREGDRRGVVFLRELVPRRLIAWSARLLANEPYAQAPMHSARSHQDGALEVEHTLAAGGRDQRLLMQSRDEAHAPGERSDVLFFTERHWGYGRSWRGRLLRYKVHHPIWRTYPVERFELDWDFGAVFGREWSHLRKAEPHSVVLAEGSEIGMRPGN